MPTKGAWRSENHSRLFQVPFLTFAFSVRRHWGGRGFPAYDGIPDSKAKIEGERKVHE